MEINMIRVIALATLSVGLFMASTMLLAKERDEPLPHTTDSLEQVKELVQQKKAVLVDVRSQPEWDQGHIKGAVFLPWRDLQSSLKKKDVEAKLSKDVIVYTYCAVGYRSARAGKIIADYGYDVRALKPGFDEIVKAGFESEKK